MKRRTRRSIAWSILLIISLAWPPIYSSLVHPWLNQRFDDGFVSNGELKNLLQARRYTIDIPKELDGHFLTFDAIIDGKTTQGSGVSVEGGSRVVLLLRRDQESRKVEYCWLDRNTVARGILDDPLSGAGTSTWREDGLVKPGDWLLRGGRKSVQVYPANEPAEFELRLAFDDP